MIAFICTITYYFLLSHTDQSEIKRRSDEMNGKSDKMDNASSSKLSGEKHQDSPKKETINKSKNNPINDEKMNSSNTNVNIHSNYIVYDKFNTFSILAT